MAEALPILFPANQLINFINCKMTYKKNVIILADHFKADDF